MRSSLLAAALDNNKTKDKNVAKCSDTTRLYSRDFNSALCIPHGVYFFLPYEGKLGIKIIDGRARKIMSSYARTASCRIFRKNAFKIRSRWYLVLLFVVQNIIITAAQG